MTRTPNEQEDEIILEMLCCVMVVDKTASAAEKAHIHTILSEDGSNWTTDEVNERIMKFIKRVEAQGFWSTLDDACDEAAVLPVSRVEKLVRNCITLAKGDSEFHDRERKAIGRILKKLPQLRLGENSSQQGESTPTYDVNKARGKPSIEPRSENKDVDVPIKHSGVWVVAAVFSCVFPVGALLIPNDAPILSSIDRGWLILLSIILSLVIAYVGLEVASVGIRDVILPGDMKDLMNKVTEAKKAAEANLISRREETAAMRSQANTAKVLADNPTLMRLRELEVLERIATTGNLNVVLGEKGLADRVVNLL
jgi:uncharacterized tellurite resistance protein B-like protein